MLNLRPVIFFMGLLTVVLSVAMCLPALVDVADGNADWVHFVEAALIAGFLGGVAVSACWDRQRIHLDLRQAFLITTLGWIVVSVVAAIPFVSLGHSLTDAVFETMSGITTTGSTVFSHLDSQPLGVLLWRALLQWVGGIGIIAMAILMLPVLRVGGMQLFRIESSESSEKVAASAVKTILYLFLIYVILTVACALLFYLFGMSAFDAITHSMTTLSTGGYSTHDASFAYFKQPALHWIATVFMVLGSFPFYLYARAATTRGRAMFADEQVRGLVSLLVITSVLMAFWLYFRRDIGFFDALQLTAFNVTSVVTTTGFVTQDYTTWGSGAIGVFLVLMYFGGCSGSTAGAIKIYRLQIVYRIVRVHVKRLFSPHRVMALHYNGKTVPDDVPYSILAFLTVYVATISLFTMALALMGLDLVTAYSATVTAIANVGPGLGNVVGPAGNFASLPDAAKWLLIFAMLAGRLEVLALLVVFDREFWRY